MIDILKPLLLIFLVTAALAVVQDARACGGDDAVYPEVEPTPTIISLSTL